MTLRFNIEGIATDTPDWTCKIPKSEFGRRTSTLTYCFYISFFKHNYPIYLYPTKEAYIVGYKSNLHCQSDSFTTFIQMINT
ncbi:hypothetical protein H5410_046700 [Solanum commersonii]|uniref:Uncharacterized protein n=1 Tax=Solanum commersonii TaxID=4109 RepID=A0A9J5XF18_SOLCO|nr:hypothetical protein H5410_046700 [Solanum commersonii]